MSETRKTYFVRTEERNYNHVTSPAQFKKVRKNWEDYSYVERAFVWVNGEGWVDVDTVPFMVGA